MSYEITCNFGGIGQPKYSEIFTVYKLSDNEKNLPNFIPNKYLYFAIDKLELGQYVETIDGYICPVIKNSGQVFRIASKKGSGYSKYAVKSKKMEVYFNPPHGYFSIHKKGRSGRKLLTREKVFCWVYALTWNIKEALDKAGYLSNNLLYGNQLLKTPKIRQGIVNAFRTQIKMAGIKERDFVINRVLKLFNTLEFVTEDLAVKIKQQDKVTFDDIDPLLKIMELNKDIMEKLGNWLGYENNLDESQFKMQIEGKRVFNYLPGSKVEYPEDNSASSFKSFKGDIEKVDQEPGNANVMSDGRTLNKWGITEKEGVSCGKGTEI